MTNSMRYYSGNGILTKKKLFNTGSNLSAAENGCMEVGTMNAAGHHLIIYSSFFVLCSSIINKL